jgi:hypothetical protein
MTARWLVDGIPSHLVAGEWEKIWPIIERAVRRAPAEHRYKCDELKTLCATARGQLWIVWDFEKQEYAAACVTQLTSGEGGLALDIPLVAGRDMKEWIIPLWTILKLWGIQHGCNFALGYGRRGWERVLGFDFYGHTRSGQRIMIRGLSLEQ